MSEADERLLRELLIQLQAALMQISQTIGSLQADSANAQRSRAIVREELQAQREEMRETAQALHELARATERVAGAVTRLEPRLETAEQGAGDWLAAKRAGRWWVAGLLAGASLAGAAGAAVMDALRALLRGG